MNWPQADWEQMGSNTVVLNIPRDKVLVDRCKNGCNEPVAEGGICTGCWLQRQRKEENDNQTVA